MMACRKRSPSPVSDAWAATPKTFIMLLYSNGKTAAFFHNTFPAPPPDCMLRTTILLLIIKSLIPKSAMQEILSSKILIIIY